MDAGRRLRVGTTRKMATTFPKIIQQDVDSMYPEPELSNILGWFLFHDMHCGRRHARFD
jgi:hypothetical protein